MLCHLACTWRGWTLSDLQPEAQEPPTSASRPCKCWGLHAGERSRSGGLGKAGHRINLHSGTLFPLQSHLIHAVAEVEASKCIQGCGTRAADGLCRAGEGCMGEGHCYIHFFTRACLCERCKKWLPLLLGPPDPDYARFCYGRQVKPKTNTETRLCTNFTSKRRFSVWSCHLHIWPCALPRRPSAAR